MVEYINREAVLRDWPLCDELADAYQFIRGFPAADVVERKTGKNIAIEYDDCDQFVCSECGIELQDWRRVERDEDDGDITYHEYILRYCPNCGAKIVEN